MTRIEKVKQKAILEVAESLGYSFKRLSEQVYEHPKHDSFMIRFGLYKAWKNIKKFMVTHF